MNTLGLFDFSDTIQRSFGVQSLNIQQSKDKITENFEKGLISEDVFNKSMNTLEKGEQGEKGKSTTEKLEHPKLGASNVDVKKDVVVKKTFENPVGELEKYGNFSFGNDDIWTYKTKNSTWFAGNGESRDDLARQIVDKDYDEVVNEANTS